MWFAVTTTPMSAEELARLQASARVVQEYFPEDVARFYL